MMPFHEIVSTGRLRAPPGPASFRSPTAFCSPERAARDDFALEQINFEKVYLL
jgi:hypothetical protein